MSDIQRRKPNLSLDNVDNGQVISHLTPDELTALTNKFRENYDERENARKGITAAQYGRYWLIFLFLRNTGARLTEVLSINEDRDIDVRHAEVTLLSLKKRRKAKQHLTRVVPVPPEIINEYLRFINLHPDFKGKAFKVNRIVFFLKFREFATEVGIPMELAHPHILRHTRAIELLRRGVPVTIVQQLLGHATLSTTALYLKYSAVETKSILKDKGVI